ncbi:MAG: hypothetical protein DWQ36_19300 [Acidobacteria bacterium]|nr:MAG: hypothetical protein DWQ30_06340 [Acidobacteriota bacterium]REK03690.1 MAG: hypothetical protein DWQ36_19300 [Acidobacteriota bacterium]
MSPVVLRSIWAALALAAGGATYLVLALSRGFPWQFALASAGGVSGLVFVVLMTVQRLRQQLRLLRQPWF